jgi:hypothetical protein
VLGAAASAVLMERRRLPTRQLREETAKHAPSDGERFALQPDATVTVGPRETRVCRVEVVALVHRVER